MSRKRQEGGDGAVTNPLPVGFLSSLMDSTHENIKFTVFLISRLRCPSSLAWEEWRLAAPGVQFLWKE